MKRVLLFLCVIALIVTACGGDSGGDEPSAVTEAVDSQTDDTDAPETGTETEDTESNDGSSDEGSATGLPPGGSGTVTIDGETIEAQWVGNCIIDEQFDPHPDDLDVVAALDGGLNALFIEVGYEELADGLLMRFIPELQRRSDDGSYASYEAEGQYMLAPDGNWYLDTEGGLYVALFSGQPHESEPVAAPVTVSAGNISGSLPLTSGGETVDVSFDLEIVEAVDCSL